MAANAPRWTAMEIMEFPVAAATTEQKFGAQSQFAGKTIVALWWSTRITAGPNGSPVIGTTNAAAKTTCFIKLRKGRVDYMSFLPLQALDPDYRLGQPFWLPEPTEIDWSNSSVKFTNAAYVTAGEVLVLYAYLA